MGLTGSGYLRGRSRARLLCVDMTASPADAGSRRPGPAPGGPTRPGPGAPAPGPVAPAPEPVARAWWIAVALVAVAVALRIVVAVAAPGALGAPVRVAGV